MIEITETRKVHTSKVRFGQRDASMSPRGTHSRVADAVLEHHTRHKKENGGGEPAPAKNYIQGTHVSRVSATLYTHIM